jgi:hypothetical protein
MPKPAIDLLPSLPPALNEIILMAIAKNPEKRFQTAVSQRFKQREGSTSGNAGGRTECRSGCCSDCGGSEYFTSCTAPPSSRLTGRDTGAGLDACCRPARCALGFGGISAAGTSRLVHDSRGTGRACSSGAGWNLRAEQAQDAGEEFSALDHCTKP